MALEEGLLTFEELKRQAEDIGLEGKERTKFLTEGWRKIQDAAAEERKQKRESWLRSGKQKREDWLLSGTQKREG